MSSEEVCRRTGRTLKEILKEHTYAVKLANMNNGVTAHLIDWDYSAKVRKQKRKVIEAIHIKSMPRTSNLDYGLYLNPMYGYLSYSQSNCIITQTPTAHYKFYCFIPHILFCVLTFIIILSLNCSYAHIQSFFNFCATPLSHYTHNHHAFISGLCFLFSCY